MFKRVTGTVLATVYTQVAALAIFILTSKFYGSEGRGIYASSISIGTFATSILSLSVGIVLPHLVVTSGETRETFFKKSLATIVALVVTLSTVSLAGVFVACALHPALAGNVPMPHLVAIGLSFPFFMWSVSSNLIFSAAGAISAQNRIGLINRTAFLAVSVLLTIGTHARLLTYLFAYSAFNILQMAQEIQALSRSCNARLRLDLQLAKRLVYKGATVHAVTIASMLNSTFSVLTLNYYVSDIKEVGYFNFASQLSVFVMVIPMVVNRFFLSDITATDAITAWARQRRAMLACLLFMIPVCLCAYFLVVPFCRLFKAEFAGSVYLFRLFLIAVVPSSFCAMMQSQWFSSGAFGLMSGINIAVGVVCAVTTLMLVPRFHAVGAAMTTILNYSILAAINLVFFARLNRAHQRQTAAAPNTDSEFG